MYILTTGYGFVDFDSPAAALKAVHALKTSGIQAQMAKVSLLTGVPACDCLCVRACVCTYRCVCARVVCVCDSA